MKGSICLIIITLYIYSLLWDEETDTYSNNDGVTIRPKGGLEGVEYLTADKSPKYAYFHEMVDYLVNEHGYRRGRSIRAVPYDWRLAGGIYHMHALTCIYSVLLYLYYVTY